MCPPNYYQSDDGLLRHVAKYMSYHGAIGGSVILVITGRAYCLCLRLCLYVCIYMYKIYDQVLKEYES